MNRDDFQALMDREFEALKDLRRRARDQRAGHDNRTKGREYAGGDEDALANFKQIARETGLTPEQVWGVYTTKHYKAIQSYVREGKVHSEPIEGRIRDLILYGFLLLALVEEKDGQNLSMRMASEAMKADQ